MTYEAAKSSNTLPVDHELQNSKPDTISGCEDETDPLGTQIDEYAFELKDL